MPMYEYRCGRCDQRFEKLVRLGTDPSEVGCPDCGAREASRLLSAAAGHVKGGGGAVSSAPARSCGSSGFG